jgi:hypothetical protein
MRNNPGRIAGLWYLLLCMLGPLRLIYIPSKLFVRGDAAATVANIAEHVWLFRFGIVTDMLCGVVMVLLGLALYRLFHEVDHTLAVQVVIFGGIMPALLDLIGVVCDLGALRIARGDLVLAAFDRAQQDAIALLLLKLRDYQYDAAEILWGVWLFPLAALVYRSRFLPRFLGVWLALGGITYVALSVTGVLAPQYQGRLFSMGQPLFFGELAFMLWLVVKGARPDSVRATVALAS